MNRHFSIRFAAAALLSATLAGFAGCGELYKEDMTDCYDGVSVVLRVDPSMTEAGAAEEAAEHAVIYVFDNSGNFLERRETEIGKVEYLSYRDAGNLTVVGWINKCTTWDVTTMADGSHRDDGLVTLNTGASTRATADAQTRADADHHFPTDLFYGDVALTNASTSFDVEHREILAGRRVGQANITVRGLQDYAQRYDENYYIEVTSTANQIDFYGEHTDWQAAHTTASAFVASKASNAPNAPKELVAPNFNVMPTDDSSTPKRELMTVSIYHVGATRAAGDELIYSTAIDSRDNPIEIVADYTTNILIDFTMGVNVTVERTRWNVTHPWKTFN